MLSRVPDEKFLSELTDRWKIDHEETAALVSRSERGMYQELRGRGDIRIYRHSLDGQTLAVSTENERIYQNLRRLPYMKPKTGCVLLFPLDHLDEIAERVGVHRKRHLSPEQREAAAERLKLFRFQAQNAARTGDGTALKPTIVFETDTLSNEAANAF